jgi:chemotaxis protein CheD
MSPAIAAATTDVDARPTWVYQGDFQVATQPGVVFMTVLGSCVAVCMRDPVVGIGGMNHFLLPEDDKQNGPYPSLEMRYGCYSVERLTNAILMRGGKRERLEVKVFGGANIRGFSSTIGSRNADFVERYAAKEGLTIVAGDLRGVSPRKLRYFPSTGKAYVAAVREVEVLDTLRLESEAAREIAKRRSTIDIF